MTAIFRDSPGVFAVDHVETIQYSVQENKWLVFFDSFDNGGMQEYSAQLDSVTQD